MTTPLPKQYGVYRAVRLVGRGGVGCVFEAVHTQIQRRVALKVLSENLAGDRKLAARFLNEARAANIVSHPSLVAVSDFGEQDGIPYIVMEFLEGATLTERLKSLGGQPMQLSAALLIVRQIASGLDAAHAKGVVHRDLKPSNIMLVPDMEMPDGERVKILDFGVVKFLENRPGPDNDHSMLTAADSRLGTPPFMSPEQCRNSSEVTDRSDIYSLGVMLYWLLSGAPPFVGATDMAIMMQHLTGSARPLVELAPTTPLPVLELVDRMLAKPPAERPSAREVVNVLSPLLKGPISYGTLPVVSRAQHPSAETGSGSHVKAPSQTSASQRGQYSAPNRESSASSAGQSSGNWAKVPGQAITRQRGLYAAPKVESSASSAGQSSGNWASLPSLASTGEPERPTAVTASPSLGASTGARLGDVTAIVAIESKATAPPSRGIAALDPEATARTKAPDATMIRAAKEAHAARAAKNRSARSSWVRPVGLATAAVVLLGLMLRLFVGAH